MKILYREDALARLPDVYESERIVHKEPRMCICIKGEKKTYLKEGYKGQRLLRILNARKTAELELEALLHVWNSKYKFDPPEEFMPHRVKRMIFDKPLDSKFFYKIPERQNPREFDRNLMYKGQPFRSKSECVIAEVYDELGISYKYETELKTATESVYPDFMCYVDELDRTFYHEHFGMLDSANYKAKVMSKQNSFLSTGFVEGIDVVYTYEKGEICFNKDALIQKVNGLMVQNLYLR